MYNSSTFIYNSLVPIISTVTFENTVGEKTHVVDIYRYLSMSVNNKSLIIVVDNLPNIELPFESNLEAITALNLLQPYFVIPLSVFGSTIANRIYEFPLNSLDLHEVVLVDSKMTVDFDSAILTNVDSVIFTINDVVVTGEQTLEKGDSFTLEISRTTNAFASVELAFEFEIETQTIEANEVNYVHWTNAFNVDVIDYFSTTKRAVISNSSQLSVNYANYICGVEAHSGQFTVEWLEIPNYSVLGLSLTNSGVMNLNNMKFSVFNNASGLYVYENAFVFAMPITGGKYDSSSIRIVDTGSAIQYWYRSNPTGVWTLAYTSAQTYVPNRTYYQLLIFGDGGKLIEGGRYF